MVQNRIVVIAPSISHPRYIRRVNALLAAGYHVTVYSFERGYYNCNSFPSGCELINMGFVKDGHYFERIFKILNAVGKIWLQELRRPQAKLVYAFELDCAILGYLAVKSDKGIVYEVGDLRSPTSGYGIIGRVIQRIEDILLQRSTLLVNTSAAFINHFFEKRYPGLKEKTLIIENKLPQTVIEKNPRPSFRSSLYPIKIGFVGLLRYEKAFLPLLTVIAQNKDLFSLHIYGDGPLRMIIENKIKEHSNIHYYGPFKNPEDLPKIYNSLDICYVVYDNSDINVRLALPNKLYEATYFCVPILVATGTILCERVKEWGIGWAVDPQEKDFLDNFFCEISLEDIDRKKRNSAAVNQEYLIENWDDFNYYLQS